MSYFGIDLERYDGWSKEQKEEELENAELPPDRTPRKDVDEDCVSQNSPMKGFEVGGTMFVGLGAGVFVFRGPK